MTDLARIDQDAVLRALRLDPRDPNAQAALLICDRYGLDPVMKHVVLIQGRPYITRDGYLTIAHRSGQLDGIEVVEQGDNDTHWTATVAVYRKDMGRPFTYVGRHPKRSGNQYGPEMAVKTAEVQALRRAFEVTGVGAADEQWEDTTPTPVAAEVLPDADERVEDREEVASAEVLPDPTDATSPPPDSPDGLVVDVPPVVDPSDLLADPEARIPRSAASALSRRLEQLDSDQLERVRMVWTENKFPLTAQDRMRPTQLSEQQHRTIKLVVDALLDPPADDLDEPAEAEADTEAEWPSPEEARGLLEDGGLVDA